MNSRYPLGPATVPASGSVSLSAKPGPRKRWIVTQIAVQCSGSALLSTAIVTVNGAFVCGTNSGNQDAAAGSPPTLVTDAETIAVTWAGASPGAIASATLFYDEVLS